MKNILYRKSCTEIKTFLKRMRLVGFILFVFIGSAFASESYSQEKRITIVSDKFHKYIMEILNVKPIIYLCTT